MRAELMLALRRDSAELEHEAVEQRVDAAYERVYEYLEPAAAYLRSILDDQGLRAFRQYEAAVQQALEFAARSGVGFTAKRRLELSDAPRRTIPTVAPAEPILTTPPIEADPDHVLRVGFRG
jgi:CHASE1-domain containing sensor protein